MRTCLERRNNDREPQLITIHEIHCRTYSIGYQFRPRCLHRSISDRSFLLRVSNRSPTPRQPTKKQKLFLMLWCPDEAKIKAKMLYSSSFDALKKSLTGVAKYVEVSDGLGTVGGRRHRCRLGEAGGRGADATRCDECRWWTGDLME